MADPLADSPPVRRFEPVLRGAEDGGLRRTRGDHRAVPDPSVGHAAHGHEAGHGARCDDAQDLPESARSTRRTVATRVVPPTGTRSQGKSGRSTRTGDRGPGCHRRSRRDGLRPQSSDRTIPAAIAVDLPVRFPTGWLHDQRLGLQRIPRPRSRCARGRPSRATGGAPRCRGTRAAAARRRRSRWNTSATLPRPAGHVGSTSRSADRRRRALPNGSANAGAADSPPPPGADRGTGSSACLPSSGSGRARRRPCSSGT